MSRRTRISRDIRHRRLGTNHHSIYSSSSTSFPSSYSIFGTPISMPAKILPLIQNNKINYVSKPEQLLYNQCPLITLEYQHIRDAKQVNLTIAGKLIQKQNKIITRIVFFLSMILCCLLSVFGCSWFRKKCYARYKTSLEQYRKLSGILNQLESCEKLILNIQDNDLNDQKIQLIEKAIMTSKVEQNRLESDRQIAQTQRKKVVTIRNFCYFMNQMDINKSFKHLMGNENIQFIFVWQKQVISSSKDKGKNSESESMLGSKFGF